MLFRSSIIAHASIFDSETTDVAMPTIAINCSYPFMGHDYEKPPGLLEIGNFFYMILMGK